MDKNRKQQAQLLILKTLKNKSLGLSSKDLLMILEKNEIFVDKRTFQRYIKELKDCFFIQYNYIHKSYKINEFVVLEELDLYVSILQMNITNQSIINSLEKPRGKRSYIYSDVNKSFKGIEHIKLIIKAIEANKQLEFTYLKQFVESSTRVVFPVFVKEYQHRWYLIAEDKQKNDAIRIFGLDRIKNLSLGDKQNFITENDYDEVFDKLIGVDTRGVLEKKVKVTEVIFKAYEQQKHYFKSLPLHSSQELIEEDTKSAVFKITVYPNYELKQHFLHFSHFVELLEPKWLRQEIKLDLQNILKKYND